jgi:hypothetical protein
MAESWRMFAVRLGDGLLHYVEHDRRTVAMCDLPEPIVEVDARLVADGDSEATHWAWIETGEDKPVMVFPAWVLFNICFPYGARTEQEHGKGRIVRLAVTEASR